MVAGAGLAGLVTAERLSALGRRVLILEASPKAGGRCRSYHDERLGRVIDNGNHLILSANTRVLDWAERIGGAASLSIGEAVFPFLDLETGSRFEVSPGRGPLGGLRRSARPPGVPLAGMAAQMARLAWPRRGATVAETLPGRGPLRRAFWDPMTRAILNEAPEVADAGLLRAAVLRSFARGAGACRLVLAPCGLGPALVDPALALLAQRGVELRLRTPLRAIHTDGSRAVGLVTGAGDVALGPRDQLILALPARATAALLPDLTLPAPGQPIVNVHFLLPDSGLPPILGLIGGAAQWLFRRDDVVSVTVSAADASPVAGLAREDLLLRLWGDVTAAVSAHGARAPATMPPARLLRERSATFAQTPQEVPHRQPTATRWHNVMLAGDHVRTGLPATLEGAVISGERAARAVARNRGQGSGP